MLRYRFLSVLLVSFGLDSGLSRAQEKPASPILMTMGPIDAESDQKATAITIRYDAKPTFERPKIEAMGSFLQVKLPHTLALQSGQFVDAKSPYIRKFAAFQIDEQTAAIRLFVSKDAALLASAFSVDILENRVVIVLDNIQAEKSLLPSAEVAAVSLGSSSDEVVRPASVIKENPDATIAELPANSKILNKKVTADSSSESSSQKPNDDLKEKLVIVTSFLVAMLVLLIGLKSWRRFMSKKWPHPQTQDLTMKTLATHPLGPKQKLTVIQVGHEQILLGVSHDQINFLSSLKNTAESQVREALQMPTNSRPLQAQVRREQILEPTHSRQVTKKLNNGRDKLPEQGSSIAYGISDEGIKNMRSSRVQPPDQESIEDVTKLIRKKLRDLPKV